MIKLGEVPAAFEHPAVHVPPVSKEHGADEARPVTPNSLMFTDKNGLDDQPSRKTEQEIYREKYNFRAAVEIATQKRVWVDDKTFDARLHREIRAQGDYFSAAYQALDVLHKRLGR